MVFFILFYFIYSIYFFFISCFAKPNFNKFSNWLLTLVLARGVKLGLAMDNYNRYGRASIQSNAVSMNNINNKRQI
jgi:hypothetical protein